MHYFMQQFLLQKDGDGAGAATQHGYVRELEQDHIKGRTQVPELPEIRYGFLVVME